MNAQRKVYLFEWLLQYYIWYIIQEEFQSFKYRNCL